LAQQVSLGHPPHDQGRLGRVEADREHGSLRHRRRSYRSRSAWRPAGDAEAQLAILDVDEAPASAEVRHPARANGRTVGAARGKMGAL
jgi:hypothetical protein